MAFLVYWAMVFFIGMGFEFAEEASFRVRYGAPYARSLRKPKVNFYYCRTPIFRAYVMLWQTKCAGVPVAYHPLS